MKTSTFLIIISCLFIFTSCARPQKNVSNGAYSIDSKIANQVDKKIKQLGELTMCSMDFKMFENDSVVADTYSSGKSFDQCMEMSTLQGDTINIIVFAGMFAGFGYQLSLFRDTCIVTHFIKSDAEIYKLHKTDSLTFGIDVPCSSYKLTLVNKPTFKKDEIVEGIIDLTSDEYYEVSNKEERKYKVKLTGYFKTSPLADIHERNKELEERAKNWPGKQ